MVQQSGEAPQWPGTHPGCSLQRMQGDPFAVGEIDYELDTEVHTQEDGGFLIEWDKRSGTRFIKHLRGELRLTPTGEEAEHTDIDYLIEVAAPRLSTAKLAAKAEAYLTRLGSILEERHQGHPSLWEGMEERRSRAVDPD